MLTKDLHKIIFVISLNKIYCWEKWMDISLHALMQSYMNIIDLSTAPLKAEHIQQMKWN